MSSQVLLLNNYSQLHSGVDGAVDVVGSGDGEGADFHAVVVHLNIVDEGRASFAGRFRRIVLPCAVIENVDGRGIVYQQQF